MSDMKATLKKIESMLASVVGSEKTETVQPMTAAQFTEYAQNEIVQAMSESTEQSTKRLKALQKSVRVAKDNFTDTEATVNVPIYVCEQTSLDDKQTQLMTPDKSASANPDNETVFEDGFVAKMERALSDMIKAMGGDGDDEEEEPEEKKKVDAGGTGTEPEEPEKAEDVEENDDSMKANGKAQKRLAKADRSADGTEWPSDLNDRDFVEKGVATKELDFGRD